MKYFSQIYDKTLPPNPLNVLIADDASPMRNMVKYMLGKLGFHNFYEAENGSVAIKILEKNLIGLIIADINMPKMTGIEFLKKIRSNEKYQKIPFVMITGTDEKECLLQSFKFGVTDYILKPIDARLFLKKITQILNSIE